MVNNVLRVCRAKWTLAIVAGALTIVACGGGEPAEDVAREQIELTSDGQFAEVWDLLHPAQQAVVPRDLYIECGTALAEAGRVAVDRIEIDDAEEEERNVPWIGDTTATVVDATVFRGEDPSYRVVTLVKSDDDWRWVIGDSQIDALEAFGRGECP